MLKSLMISALFSTMFFFQANESFVVKQVSIVDGDVNKTIYQLTRGEHTVAWASQEKKNSNTLYKSGWKLGNIKVQTFATSEAFFNTLSILHQKTI